MIIGAGLDNSIFGNGLRGDVTINAAANIEGDGDYNCKTLTIAKNAPGDPSFSVFGAGQRYIATRKIFIGLGATLVGRKFAATATGAPSTTLGGGKNGGPGGIGAQAGTGGDGSSTSMGGASGAGGNTIGHIGGANAGAVSTGLKGAQETLAAMLSGHALVAGTMIPIVGGAGGGGGASEGGGSADDGGGGAGVTILCAPIIQIDGVVDFSGHAAGGGALGAEVGGGGGGGGGFIVMVYGTLILNGSILVNGGNGSNGFGAVTGLGGNGGAGGHLWRFNGDWENFLVTTGSAGSNGVHG